MAVVTITTENFAQEVLHSDKPVLLDFWASWCGPCRMLSPIVDEVAEERSDIKVGKVNVDEQPDLAAQFGVMSIPTLLIFNFNYEAFLFLNSVAYFKETSFISPEEILAISSITSFSFNNRILVFVLLLFTSLLIK